MQMPTKVRRQGCGTTCGAQAHGTGAARAGATSPYLPRCAIRGGAVVRTCWAPSPRWRPGIGFSAKMLLEIAVFLLGASISARSISAAGPNTLVLGIAGVVVMGIAVSFTIGRVLGLPAKMAALVACGNAICGNSAIAAVAPSQAPWPSCHAPDRRLRLGACFRCSSRRAASPWRAEPTKLDQDGAGRTLPGDMTGGTITITARATAQTLTLAVADDGVGLFADQLSARRGIGLANTEARLQALHGAAAKLDLITPPEGGLRVEITLPFKTTPPSATPAS